MDDGGPPGRCPAGWMLADHLALRGQPVDTEGTLQTTVNDGMRVRDVLPTASRSIGRLGTPAASSARSRTPGFTTSTALPGYYIHRPSGSIGPNASMITTAMCQRAPSRQRGVVAVGPSMTAASTPHRRAVVAATASSSTCGSRIMPARTLSSTSACRSRFSGAATTTAETAAARPRLNIVSAATAAVATAEVKEADTRAELVFFKR